MYDTGLVEELRDLLFRKGDKAAERVGGLDDWFDRAVEHVVRRPGTLVWNEMKRDAQDAFISNGAGTEALKLFIKHLRAAPPNRRKKIHLVGHSTGGVLFAHLLQALSNNELTIESCVLMAPACTVDLYQKCYLPVLQGKKRLKIRQMYIYNLKDKLEKDDVVLSSSVYRKSLLYLVSNAFERVSEHPLLGMEKFNREVKRAGSNPTFFHSNGVSGSQSRSTSQGDFDNDVYTMNHIVKTILHRQPDRRFTKADLTF